MLNMLLKTQSKAMHFEATAGVSVVQMNVAEFRALWLGSGTSHTAMQSSRA